MYVVRSLLLMDFWWEVTRLIVIGCSKWLLNTVHHTDITVGDQTFLNLRDAASTAGRKECGAPGFHWSIWQKTAKLLHER